MRHFYGSFFILVAVFLWANSVAWAQPANYYSSAEGKTGYALKTALHNIIKNHQVQSYSSLWNHFQSTDKKPNGKAWDMYSDVPGGTPAYEYSFGSDQCGSYSKEGDCYNREHSFPKSWFNNASPMYSDLFHLYPTDGYVNQRRGNYPYQYHHCYGQQRTLLSEPCSPCSLCGGVSRRHYLADTQRPRAYTRHLAIPLRSCLSALLCQRLVFYTV